MKKIAVILLVAALIPLGEATVKPAGAQNLFETLFPRAAKRKREREARERARRLAIERSRTAKKIKKIKRPTFKLYQAATLKPIRLDTLSNSFSAALATEAARQALDREAHLRSNLIDKKFSLDAYAALPRPLTQKGSRLIDGLAELATIEVPARANIAQAVLAHYSKSPQFMWIDQDGLPNRRAIGVMAVLETADQHALDPADYKVSSPPPGADIRILMDFEFAMTARALRYALDARYGITTPEKISIYHDFTKNRPDPAGLIEAMDAAERPHDFLLSLHPRDRAYRQLLATLKELQGNTDALPPISIAPGTFLKPGVTNPEVANVVEAARRIASPELQDKHGYVFGSDHSLGLYDENVVAMVRDVQQQLKLKPDGIVGKRTIAKLLPAGSTNKIGKVKLAIERLRWHPDRFGSDYVFINQPAYRVQLFRDGSQRIAMNVVVGKPSNQTSFFHDEIEYVEFNPYWGIPKSILVNEMLPKLRANPGYFDNLGYEVTDRRGRSVSSWSVNWNGVGADFPFDVRQPPGPKNALGQLKIMFPNRHAIYMHDTPAKSLFSRSRRAFSHGCVRLSDPKAMAAAVLQTSVGDIEGAIATRTNNRRNLKRKLPVYVAYFTAWPDEAGTVRYFADIYDRDKALTKALEAESEERASAENS